MIQNDVEEIEQKTRFFILVGIFLAPIFCLYWQFFINLQQILEINRICFKIISTGSEKLLEG